MKDARFVLLAIAAALSAAASMSNATPTMTGDVKPLAAIQFAPDEDVACLSSAVETGDPASGASTILLKATPGCVVPWHYHTAVEQLLVVSGTVLTEMSGHPPGQLLAGGFAVMDSMAAHRFVCEDDTECLMFVIFDRKYDIFWGKGN